MYYQGILMFFIMLVSQYTGTQTTDVDKIQHNATLEFNCHIEVDGNTSGDASDSQHCSIKIGDTTANISDINIGCCYSVDSKVNQTITRCAGLNQSCSSDAPGVNWVFKPVQLTAGKNSHQVEIQNPPKIIDKSPGRRPKTPHYSSYRYSSSTRRSNSYRSNTYRYRSNSYNSYGSDYSYDTSYEDEGTNYGAIGGGVVTLVVVIVIVIIVVCICRRKRQQEQQRRQRPPAVFTTPATVPTVSTVPVAQVTAQPYTAPPTYPTAATAQYHTPPPPPPPATYHHPVPAAAVANQYYQQAAAPAAIPYQAPAPIPYQAPVTAPPVVQYQAPSAPPVTHYQQAPAAQTDTVSSQIRGAVIDAAVGQIVDNSAEIVSGLFAG